jgi:hypothetical protein
MILMPPWKYAGYYGEGSYRWLTGEHFHRYSSKSGSDLRSTSLNAMHQHSWTNGRCASNSALGYIVWRRDWNLPE